MHTHQLRFQEGRRQQNRLRSSCLQPQSLWLLPGILLVRWCTSANVFALRCASVCALRREMWMQYQATTRVVQMAKYIATSPICIADIKKKKTWWWCLANHREHDDWAWMFILRMFFLENSYLWWHNWIAPHRRWETRERHICESVLQKELSNVVFVVFLLLFNSIFLSNETARKSRKSIPVQIKTARDFPRKAGRPT